MHASLENSEKAAKVHACKTECNKLSMAVNIGFCM